MNEETLQKIEKILSGDEIQNVKLILSYAIKKTTTTLDDEIVENSAQLSTMIAKTLSDISDENPTDKEVKEAIFNLLKWFVSQTENKWDDRIVKILDMFI